MEHQYSVFLARFLGIFMTLFALGGIFNLKHSCEAAKSVAKTAGLHIPAAVVPLLLGSFIVVTHNVWTGDWRVLVTLVGWLILIGGIIRSWLVTQWADMLESNGSCAVTGFMTVALVMGLLLLYFGYVR